MPEEESVELTDGEYLDAINAPHTQRPLIDQFLLCIIRAYQVPKSKTLSDEQRLASAKEALFGDLQIVGRDEVSDKRALSYMARAYISDRGGVAMRIGRPPGWYPEKVKGARSIKQLAKEAAHRTSGCEDQIIERLRKKFRKKRSGLLRLATFGDYVPETLIAQTLPYLKKIMAGIGIKMHLSDKPDAGKKGHR